MGVVTDISPEDIAAMRAQGDFRDFLRSLKAAEAAQPAPLAAVPEPAYRITHTGGWPLGATASGPTPPPDVCTCAKCKTPAPVRLDAVEESAA